MVNAANKLTRKSLGMPVISPNNPKNWKMSDFSVGKPFEMSVAHIDENCVSQSRHIIEDKKNLKEISDSICDLSAKEIIESFKKADKPISMEIESPKQLKELKQILKKGETSSSISSLVSGYHRWQAHLNHEEAQTIWTVAVFFENDEQREWYETVANAGFPSKTRTVADIVELVKNWIRKFDPTITPSAPLEKNKKRYPKAYDIFSDIEGKIDSQTQEGFIIPIKDWLKNSSGWKLHGMTCDAVAKRIYKDKGFNIEARKVNSYTKETAMQEVEKAINRAIVAGVCPPELEGFKLDGGYEKSWGTNCGGVVPLLQDDCGYLSSQSVRISQTNIEENYSFSSQDELSSLPTLLVYYSGHGEIDGDRVINDRLVALPEAATKLNSEIFCKMTGLPYFDFVMALPQMNTLGEDNRTRVPIEHGAILYKSIISPDDGTCKIFKPKKAQGWTLQNSLDSFRTCRQK